LPDKGERIREYSFSNRMVRFLSTGILLVWQQLTYIINSNYGYLNHFHNFKCFADRLGFKYLVISMDPRSHEYLMTRNITSVFLGGDVKIEEGSSVFRSKQFNLITIRKMTAVLNILRHGYDVIFCDTDVALVRDPLSFLNWSNVDYIHSHNMICPR